VNVHGV